MKRATCSLALTLSLILVFGGMFQVHGRMMGPGPMGQPGQRMEPPASAPEGALGPQMMPQMRRGMMGGGMEGESHSLRQMAGVPRDVTQQDTQGAVTVEVTLLTPDQPRADGTLAVQVKLDTHAVDLEQYQLEKLAVLRDAQGREVEALAIESASGDGHHRQAVLTFPAIDADGKPLLSPETEGLTLVLRGVGGVPERAFRWPL